MRCARDFGSPPLSDPVLMLHKELNWETYKFALFFDVLSQYLIFLKMDSQSGVNQVSLF